MSNRESDGRQETDFQVGKRYDPDKLPENQMNKSGKVENVGADLFALALPNGQMIEFKMALECTAIYEIADDGGMGEVIAGKPAPLGRETDE